MEEVIRRHVCELHPDRVSKMEGLRFFWPPTGTTHQIDPCDECTDPITAALGPFAGQARELRGQDVLMHVDEHVSQANRTSVPAPSSYRWLVCKNEQAKTGKGKSHATADGIMSRCGLVHGADRWLGPSKADDEQCKQCILGLNADARKRAEATFAELMTHARMFARQYRANHNKPVTRDIVKAELHIGSGAATEVVRILRKEKEL